VFEFFKRLFPDKHEGGFKVDQSTLPLQSNPALTKAKALSRAKYRVATCLSTGKARSHNEDTLFTFNSFMDGIDSSAAFGIYLVADGMGGHQSGEVASSLAAQAASQYLVEKVFEKYLYDREPFSEDELSRLTGEAVDAAQALIRNRVPGGGTTLTLVMAIGDHLFSAHVGDSRLYMIGTEGGLTLKTRDHSLVKRLIDLGEITEKEASVHPQRNVLYRALGQMDPFDPDLDHFSIQTGERLLICSDGLWGVLEPEQLRGILNKSADLDRTACDLVHAANDSGGPDNISVVLLERLA